MEKGEILGEMTPPTAISDARWNSMVETLQFYADTRNWTPTVFGRGMAIIDQGSMARTVLTGLGTTSFTGARKETTK